MSATTVIGSRADSAVGISLYPEVSTEMYENRSIYKFGPRGSAWEGCTYWFATMPGAFFQAGFMFFALSYMAGGNNPPAVVYGHVCNAVAFISFAIFGCIDICAPDVVGWSLFLAFVVIVQAILQITRIKKLEKIFSVPGISTLYNTRFAPFDVSQQLFSELVKSKKCENLKLKKGEKYATEGKTRVDKLSILLSGRMSVYCKDKFLHFVNANTFVDSPEWDSLTPNDTGKTTFKVTIVADTDCNVISWKRKSLVSLLTKEKQLNMIITHMIGRDVTNKLLNLNDRQMTHRGFRYDIRLPCIISLARDVKRRQRTQSIPATPGSPMDSEGDATEQPPCTTEL